MRHAVVDPAQADAASIGGSGFGRRATGAMRAQALDTKAP